MIPNSDDMAQKWNRFSLCYNTNVRVLLSNVILQLHLHLQNVSKFLQLLIVECWITIWMLDRDFFISEEFTNSLVLVLPLVRRRRNTEYFAEGRIIDDTRKTIFDNSNYFWLSCTHAPMCERENSLRSVVRSLPTCETTMTSRPAKRASVASPIAREYPNTFAARYLLERIIRFQFFAVQNWIEGLMRDCSSSLSSCFSLTLCWSQIWIEHFRLLCILVQFVHFPVCLLALQCFSLYYLLRSKRLSRLNATRAEPRSWSRMRLEGLLKSKIVPLKGASEI